MNKKLKAKESDKGEAKLDSPLESPKRERIGIMYGRFVSVKSHGSHTDSRAFKTWDRGQVVFKESDIEDLLRSNAPMKVYIDANGCSEG